MDKDNDQWVANLQPGDKVGVYERHGSKFLHELIVERRTPSGRIVCAGGSVFRPNCYHHVARDSPYADRCIMRPPAKD